MKLPSRILISLCPFLFVPYAFAGKKALYFDDAETVGKGKYQVENYLSYIKNKEGTESSYIFNFTYGLGEKTDAALNIPIGYLRTHGNVSKNQVSFAIKPYIGIPVKKEAFLVKVALPMV